MDGPTPGGRGPCVPLFDNIGKYFGDESRGKLSLRVKLRTVKCYFFEFLLRDSKKRVIAKISKMASKFGHFGPFYGFVSKDMY